MHIDPKTQVPENSFLLGGIEVHHHATSGMARSIDDGESFMWNDLLYSGPLDQNAEEEKGDALNVNVGSWLCFYSLLGKFNN